MLPKQYRLKKYSAFIATYRNNNSISDKNVCIYFGKKKSDKEMPTKFAFVVSKKVHKRAVVRNRIKRLMRESVKNNILNNEQYIYINNYISIIIVGKASAVDAKYSEILDSIRNLLQNIQ